jgi:uncharacterized protein
MRREIQSYIKTLLDDTDDSRIIIIEGARQVGKTYLMKNILQNIKRPSHLFDLEKNNHFKHEIESTESFEDFKALLNDQYSVKDGDVVFIDEAQESRRLAAYIKPIKEDWSEVKFILTGSSMNSFFHNSSRIPVGRYTTVTIFGFSFSEFVQYVKGESLASFLRSGPAKVPASRHRLFLELFDEYLVTGGYPEAVKAYSKESDPLLVVEDILLSLQDDFVRKEAYEPVLYRDIMEGIANNLGSPSKFTQFQTTKYKAKKALDAMKQWHLVLEVKPSSLDPLHGSFLPKRYLHDTSVANYYRTLNVPSISVIHTTDQVLRKPLGALFENSVLIGLITGKASGTSIDTWKRDGKTNIEVDFVLKSSQRSTIPIECKAALNIKPKHYKNLIHYCNSTNQNLGFLISLAPLSTIETKDGIKIVNIPIYLASRENILRYSILD